MEIISFDPSFLHQAGQLFIDHFRHLRQAVPQLPDRMEDTDQVTAKLSRLFDRRPGLAAVQDGRLVGYMGWYVVDGFRNTSRRAAYCPEWGHAAAPGDPARIYKALYAAATVFWTQAGCETHALTLLAGDPGLEKFWFWNGFGLAVVDAVRPLHPLGVAAAPQLNVRIAEADDVPALVTLEAEHRQHYLAPPVLMASRDALDAAACAEFINQPGNSIWLAEWDGQPVAFMRFASGELDAADVVQAEDTTGITGAYTRPEFRGRGVAPALLDAALQHYAALGYTRCAVDFESFNPEAASFWLRYFAPVCLSLVRVPERLPVNM